MKNQRILTDVKGVGANGTITANIATAIAEVEQIGFDLAGTTVTKTLFTALQLLANGTPIQQYLTVAQLEVISAFYAYVVNANEIKFPLARKYLKDASQAQAFNLGMSDLDTLKVQMSTGAISGDAIVTGWDTETQRVVAGMSNEQANALGDYMDVRNYPFNFTAGAGQYVITDVPRQGWLCAAHLIQTAKHITNIELWLGDLRIWNATDSRMRRILTDIGRVPDANTYHIDMLFDNELGDQVLLDGARSLEFRITTDASCSGVLYMETMRHWDSGKVYKTA